MNNEEKILALLEQMRSENNARFDKLEAKVDTIQEDVETLKEDVSDIKEDIEILKEDTAITRESTEMLLDWATVIDNVALEEVRKQRIAKALVE